MKRNEVIIKPVLTEKATKNVATNTYTFEIAMDANKKQVQDLLEKLYKVKVSQIRIFKRNGKTKTVGRNRMQKKRADRKMVYVTVSSGKIDLFPQA